MFLETKDDRNRSERVPKQAISTIEIFAVSRLGADGEVEQVYMCLWD
jgi:hypothetical protein